MLGYLARKRPFADTGWAALSTDALADSLFAAERPVDGRGRVAPEMVTDMVTVAEKYRRAYRYASASKLLPLAHGHMDLSLALHPAWQTPAVRHTLISIAGEMAALAGVTLALDMGHYRQAVPYLDLATHAARAIGSAELEAVVLGARSYLLANGSVATRWHWRWLSLPAMSQCAMAGHRRLRCHQARCLRERRPQPAGSPR